MNKELAITSQQFGLLVGIFFFGYFLFEIPSNLMLHKIGARVWIARILISWGIVAMGRDFRSYVAPPRPRYHPANAVIHRDR